MALKPETSNELRQMVREVLREVVAQKGAPAPGTSVETVRLTTDQDLALFLARVMEPQTAERIRAGQLRFTLGTATVQGREDAVLTGVITEQKIDHLKGAGRLVLGAGAVLTPLARDKARRLGLSIERRR